MSERRWWLDEPRNVDKVYYALCALCALSVVADFFYHRHYAFAFHAIYGFVACVGLVLAAKQLRKLVKRPEDYYDR